MNTRDSRHQILDTIIETQEIEETVFERSQITTRSPGLNKPTGMDRMLKTI